MRHPDSLIAALGRQKWVLLGCVGLSFAVSHVAAFFIPPHFQASARVMVPPSHYTVPGVGTEAEIIRSGALAEAVIRTLRLTSDPDFMVTGPSAPTGGFLSLSLDTPVEIPPAVTEKFLSHLRVDPVAGSYVLVITYTANDADKAAAIANALAAEYVRRQAEPPVVQPSDAVIDLDRLEALSAERERLSARYGPKHPKMIAVEKDIAAARLSAVRAKPGRTGPDVAKIVAPATPPVTALHETPSWLYGVAPFLGLLLGLLLAGLNERLDKGFKTRRALEDMTGHKVAGVIPVPKDPSSLAVQASLVLQKPSDPSAEAVRGLRAGLKLLGEKEGRPIKVVTVTSASEDPHDVQARTLTSLWLGRLAARAGEKVLIIDADLRNPHLHTLAGRSNTPSLVDYLVGQTYLEQVIWRQDPSGAHLIFGSAVPNTALDLIGGDKMKKLSSYLRHGYDLVIYCAPACMPSAEAAVLANESDQTLFMVAANHSERGDVVNGLALFAGFGYSAVSLVMTDPLSRT